VASTRYRVQVIDRACDVLERLANQELGASEIVADLGLSKSTVHRLLSVLAQRDYVWRIPHSGKYRLGAKLVELGEKATGFDRLAAIAAPYLRRLAAETGETARLGVLRDGELVLLCAAEGLYTLRMPATVGHRIPVHTSPLGKCLLADLDAEELAVVLDTFPLERFTPRTIVTQQMFVNELAKVRRLGFAIDDEEYEQGLKCVGAPVRDKAGRVRAALSIAGPASRLGPQVVESSAASVMRMARELSAELGYGPADHDRDRMGSFERRDRVKVLAEASTQAQLAGVVSK
jgi:IclR family acetate operon transcriptional repressor